MEFGRLQNYPTHVFHTEEEWSAFFSDGIAPTRVKVLSAKPINWSLRIASVRDMFVAYGSHMSDIEINQVGVGSGLHVHIPLAGQAKLTAGGSMVVASRDQATLVDLAEPHCLKIERPTGYEALALNIPRSRLNQQFVTTIGREPPEQIEFQPTLGLATAPGRVLCSITNALVTGLENNMLKDAPIAVGSLYQSILELLIRAWPHQLQKECEIAPSQIAPRHVRRAIEFMQANIGQPLSSAEIAAAAGVSVRSLETGFRTFKDTSPKAYLRDLRLAAVRHELLTSDNSASITEIACRWGFIHAGRFSAIYRKMYGELPSETIASRKD